MPNFSVFHQSIAFSPSFLYPHQSQTQKDETENTNLKLRNEKVFSYKELFFSAELYLFILFLEIFLVVHDLVHLCLNTRTDVKVKVLECRIGECQFLDSQTYFGQKVRQN